VPSELCGKVFATASLGIAITYRDNDPFSKDQALMEKAAALGRKLSLNG